MSFLQTLDPSTQPLILGRFLYTLDPRAQPLAEAAPIPPPPPPVIIVPTLQFGGGRVPDRPPAECTWEEYLADPYRCRYARITDDPRGRNREELERELKALKISLDAVPAVSLAALRIALRITDGDVYETISAIMALRLDIDSD